MAISYTFSHAIATATSVSDAFGTALAGDLLIAMAHSNVNTLPVISCVGASPTWVKIEDVSYGASLRTTIWYAVALGGETSVVATWGSSGHQGIELLWVGSPGTYNEVYVLQAATTGTLGGGHMNTPTVHPTGNGEFYIGWTSDDGTVYTFADLKTGALSADGGDGFSDPGFVAGIFHYFSAAHANVIGDSIVYSVQTGIAAYEMGVLSVRVNATPPPPTTPVSPRFVAGWITSSGGR